MDVIMNRDSLQAENEALRQVKETLGSTIESLRAEVDSLQEENLSLRIKMSILQRDLEVFERRFDPAGTAPRTLDNTNDLSKIAPILTSDEAATHGRADNAIELEYFTKNRPNLPSLVPPVVLNSLHSEVEGTMMCNSSSDVDKTCLDDDEGDNSARMSHDVRSDVEASSSPSGDAVVASQSVDEVQNHESNTATRNIVIEAPLRNSEHVGHASATDASLHPSPFTNQISLSLQDMSTAHHLNRSRLREPFAASHALTFEEERKTFPEEGTYVNTTSPRAISTRMKPYMNTHANFLDTRPSPPGEFSKSTLTDAQEPAETHIMASEGESPSISTTMNSHSVSITSPFSTVSRGDALKLATREIISHGSSTSLSPVPSTLESPGPHLDQQTSSVPNGVLSSLTSSVSKELAPLHPTAGYRERLDTSTPERCTPLIVRSHLAIDSEVSASGEISGEQPDICPAPKRFIARERRQKPVSVVPNFNDVSLRIPSNYREHNIDPAGVRIAAKADPLNPLEIVVSSNTIARVLLNDSKIKQLNAHLGSILSKWPATTNDSANERDIDFIMNLFGVHASTTPTPGWQGVALHEQHQMKHAQHKSALHEFFAFSCVPVGRYIDGIEVSEGLKALAQYDGAQQQYTLDKLAMVMWVHYFLSRLKAPWRGLELPLLMHMLKGGISSLMKMSLRANRPAYLKPLLQVLDRPKVIETYAARWHAIVGEASKRSNWPMEQMTPLGFLQNLFKESYRFGDPQAKRSCASDVAAALWYGRDNEEDIAPQSSSPLQITPSRSVSNAVLPTPVSKFAVRNVTPQQSKTQGGTRERSRGDGMYVVSPRNVDVAVAVGSTLTNEDGAASEAQTTMDHMSAEAYTISKANELGLSLVPNETNYETGLTSASSNIHVRSGYDSLGCTTHEVRASPEDEESIDMHTTDSHNADLEHPVDLGYTGTPMKRKSDTRDSCGASTKLTRGVRRRLFVDVRAEDQIQAVEGQFEHTTQ